MPSLRLTLALCATALPCVNVNAADDLPPDETIRWNTPDREAAPGLVHGSFRSDAMKLEVGYNVWLPPGYEQSQARYPVVYFLHGAGGNENSDAAAFAGLVAEFVRARVIPPVICVFPNGGHRSWYRDHPGKNVLVETMIIRELLPLVDRTYRTQPGREARVVLGFSMGGSGAVRFAVKYPDLFSAAGAWAGAFAGRHNEKLADDFQAEALAPLAGRTRLLLIAGTKDFTLAGHALMVNSLVNAKVPFEVEALLDVPHDPGAYYQHSGEKMVRFLTKGFAPAK